MSVLIGQGHILISAQLAGNFGSQLRGHFLTGTRGIAESAGRSLGSSLTAGITAGVGLGAFNMLTSSVKTLGTSLIGTASNMEQAKISFTNMLGSGQKADAFLKQLADFAAKTPFEFPDLVQASQRLMAMGFKAKDVIPTMTAVGDAVAAMGGSSEQINRVTLALGQMQAKTRVQGDELLQLQEAGIPALKILADSYGVTTVEMQKNISAGKVMSEDAIPRLINGMENGTKSVKGFAGMMEQQSHTMAGLWSTLKDTVRLDLVPAFEPLIKIAEAIMPPAIAKLSSVLGSFGQVSKNFFEGLTRGWQDVGNGTQVAVAKLSGVEKIGAAFHTGVFGVQAFFAAMKNGDVTSDGFVGAMERVGASLHNTGPAFGQLGQAIASLARERLAQFGDMFKQLLPVLAQFATFIGGNIVPLLSAFTRAIAQASGPILTALGSTLKNSIIPAMQTVAGTLMQDVLPAFARFLGTVGSAVGDVLPVLGRLLHNNIAPALAEVGRWVRDVVGPALGALAKFISTEVVPAFAKVLGPVIDGVRVALRMLRDAINDNKEHFISFYKGIKPVIDFVRDVVAPVLGVVLKVAMLATVTSITLMIRWWGLLAGAIGTVISWVKSLRVVWDAAWQALTAVLAPVWNLIRTAVATGMSIVSSAINVGMTAVRTVWNAAWSVMSTIVSAVWTVIRPIVQAGMTVVQTVISAGMTVARTLWNAAWTAISTAVSAAWVIIRPIVQAGMAVIQTVISAGMTVVRTLWSAAWSVMSTLLSAAWAVIRPIVQAGMTVIQTVISAGMTVIRTVWNAAWTVISTLMNTVWTAIKAVVSAGVLVVRTVIEAAWKVVQGIFLTVWGLIAAAFKATWLALQLIVGAATAWIRDTINTVWTFVKNNIFAPIWNAISTAFNVTWELLKTVVRLATAWIRDTINTVWNFVKNNIFAPIWNAISTAFNVTWELLKTIVRLATAWIRDTINTVWTAVKNNVFAPIWNAISTTFHATWETIKTTANNAITWVHDRIKSVLDTISRVWSDAWNGMKNVLGGIWDGIKTAIRTPVNAIIGGLNHFFDPINTVIDWAIGKKPLPHIDPVGMATGGRLPGYGGGDTVPALLEPGEAVIPKHLVPDIAAWARDKRIPGFQTGIAIPPLPTTPTQIGQPPTAIGQGSGNLSGVQTKPDPGIGILGDIVSGIGSAASAVASGIGGVAGEIAGMVGDAAKWVWAKGSGFFQLGAGLLAQGMADAAKKAIDVATGPLGQPGAVFNAVADKTIQNIVDWIKGKESAPPSAGGPGYSISGNWAPSIRPWVDYIARSNNVSANTYAGHHPAENFAVDLAIGQGGMVNTAPATGPSGNDLYSKLARWVDDHIINVPSPGWYVGTHAAIHSRGGAWHPAGDQVGRRGQTYAHDDHVHVSFDPRGRGPLIGVPGNYSVPGFTWDENGNPPVVAIPAANAAAVIGAAVGGFPWNQSQMEQAMLAVGAPANIAHIFGAIGMNENPASRPVHNQYGWFDSVWALIRSWTTSMGYDTNRLNSDIVYAAGAAYRLYQMSGFNPWEAYTNGNYLRNMMLGGLVKSYDAGGWLPTGLSLAYNGTGRPEPVGGPVQNTVNLTINVANGDPVTIRTVAQQVVDDALTTLARRLSSGAGRN